MTQACSVAQLSRRHDVAQDSSCTGRSATKWEECWKGPGRRYLQSVRSDRSAALLAIELGRARQTSRRGALWPEQDPDRRVRAALEALSNVPGDYEHYLTRCRQFGDRCAAITRFGVNYEDYAGTLLDRLSVMTNRRRNCPR
jgi:hypothetical protein